MNGILVVAARELIERRNAFLAAAVASVLPFVAPLAPWLRSPQVGEVRGAAALVMAAGLSCGLALVYGSSTIGRDLAERRLGFYFNRPLSPLAIWGGKFLAGVVLVWVTPLIVGAPTWLATGPGFLTKPMELRYLLPVLGLMAVPAALMVLAHAVGIILRDRSVWLVLDLVALAVVAVLVLWALGALFDIGAEKAVQVSEWLLLGAALTAVLVSGAVQVVSGRLDPRRGHRALSLVLWGVLLCVSAGLVAFAGWVRVTPLSAVRGVTAAGIAPSGPWLPVEARVRHGLGAEMVWLLDSASGRNVRLGASAHVGWPQFSADGRHAAWVETTYSGSHAAWLGPLLGEPAKATSEVVTLDLREGDLRPRRTTLIFPELESNVALSTSGQRLALVHEGMLSVFDLSNDALLASVRQPTDSSKFRLRFLGDDALWLSRAEENPAGPDRWKLLFYKLDLTGRRLVETGRVDDICRLGDVRVDASGRRMLVGMSGADDECTWSEREIGSAALLRTFERQPGWEEWGARFLGDGRVVVAETREGRGRLRVWSEPGLPLRDVDLGRTSQLSLLGELQPGTLLIERARSSPRYRYYVLWLPLTVDLGSGEVKLLEQGLSPIGPFVRAQGGPNAAPGDLHTSLFFSADGALILRDPTTGARRTLVPVP